MQAWVTNDPDPGHSQPGVATSAPATTYDISAPVPTQSQPQQQSQGQTQPQTQPRQTRHINIPQTKPTTTQQTSRGRSRSPTIHPNSQRAAAVTAARIPIPPRSSHAHTHTRDGSASIPHSKTTAAPDSRRQLKKQGPFWDGSTIEGSAFSDTASNIDSNTPVATRQLPAQVYPAPSYQQHDSPRYRPVLRQPNRTDQPPPFVIGSNGLINVMGNENGNGLTRSASTPEARSPRGDFIDVTFDNDHDQYADDSQYETSPEKTPLAKKIHHPNALTLRSTRGGSYSEHIRYPSGDPAAMPRPPGPHTYPTRDRDPLAKAPQAQPVALPRPVPEHQPHRSPILAGNDVHGTDHRDEFAGPGIGREPTPLPAAKPAVKAKPQVNRQLFARLSKGKVDLRESTILQSSPEKRQPATKKRSLELDYDDGALAAMDYAALKSEAFDFDPAQAEARSVFEPPRGTLPEKLEHFFTKDEADQANFFTKMPVKDWEESGDWFLERFGEIMSRFKEARQEKRDIVNAFETEIAEREEAVRKKIHGIGQTLADLKTEGEDMMLGKELR